ncbi:MAG TPA: carboxypeptidase-like regulatory domain-containing protein [Pyrinomonadaceae bacterium]|jgi:hypothetical protein
MKSIKKFAFGLLSIFVFSAVLAGTAFAQQITATLTGTITDPNGAVVPGAIVTAKSVETGQSKTATTGDQGNYTIPFLQPGTYNVTIEKAGFANTVRENIRLEIAQTASIDVTLGVTAGTVDVTVEGNETPLLQTETSNLETTIEEKLVDDLPSLERNIFSFVNLVPGTIDTNAALGNPNSQIGSSGNRNFFDSNFAVNGGRASTNDNLLDGVTNTIGDFNGVAISPPQDAVREFKVVSGVAPADYGRTGGGIVTVSSKAGTRKFHGALYEYFQDGNLNANGFFNNRRSLPRVNTSSKHQFGGAIGGPISFFNFGENDGGVFRKIANTFFFANYEGRREKNPFTRVTTVPTARMRTGDFGELLTGAVRTGVTNADGTPALFGQLYNPFSPLTTVGTTSRRQTFANNNLSTLPTCTAATNRVTTPCLDPVALAVLQYIPLPNRPGLINNYAFADNIDFTRDIVSGRIDHTVSEKQNFFARFSFEKRRNAPPSFLGSIASNVTVQKDTFFNGTFNHVYSLRDNLINNFRYGYTRAHATQAANSLGFDPTTLGLPAYLRDAASALIFPTFTIGGGSVESTIAAGELATGLVGGAGNDQPRDTHSAGDSMTYISGAHTIRFGGEYRLYRFYPFQFNTPTGSFTFSRAATAGPIVTPSTAITPIEAAGSSLASFLLGIPSGISREVQVPITVYHHYGAAFVQDDWKIFRNLTLNLGLRWDFETGTASPQRLVTSFDFEAPSPIQSAVQTRLATFTLDPAVAALNNSNIRNLTGVLDFPEGSQQETDYKRFAPRIGFAYSLNSKTTLRGGFGMFYLPISLEGASALGTSFIDSQLQSVLTTSQVTSSTVFLSNPFPNGVRPATGNTLGNLTSLGQNITNVVYPRPETAYNMQYNLVLQRELAKNLVLDIAYVGSRGRNLPSRNIELNQLSPDVLNYARANFNQPNTCSNLALPTQPGQQVNLNISCASIATFLSQQVNNPFYTLTPGSPLNNLTVARAQLLRRFPQYQSVSQLSPNIGRSDYNALQVNLQKRFSNGFSFLGNYVWSKLLDTGGVGNGARFTDPTNAEDVFNFDEEYSYSTLDVPHRFTASFTYELPLGKGKRFGSNFGALTNALFGGLQISGTGVWQTGAPITITNSVGFTGNGGLTGVNNSQIRPNRVSGVDPMAGDFGERVRQGLSVFNPDAFTPANVSNYEFGNAARTYNDIRRDNYKNVDLSVIKNIAWSEGRQRVQLRAEFLNAFNLVVFGTPVLTFGSNTFGTVTTQGNRPRIIQLVGRYTF